MMHDYQAQKFRAWCCGGGDKRSRFEVRGSKVEGRRSRSKVKGSRSNKLLMFDGCGGELVLEISSNNM